VSNGNYGYWTWNGSLNGLKGKASTFVELADGRIVTQKDPDNPAILEDEFIVYGLQHSRQARHDFCRLYPDLDADSQERLALLILHNPRATALLRDMQNFLDAVQNADVTDSVLRRLIKTRTSQIASREKVRQPGGGW
jgi:hypothetical protein